ncbi:MAG TPA: MSHA biogenesis protein MshK [Burkholderiaceae bacterium]
MKKSIKSLIAQAVLMLLFPIAASNAYAEQLRDPTRPADMLGRGQSEVAAPGPVLQYVLISPQRRIAIISGKTLKVGDKYGDAHVVGISETEVVLQNGKTQQTLKLFPDVHKRLTSSGSSAKSDH